jgi:sugar phosphate isomerase/epimerase
MPTLIETETLESYAALCRELGLDFVELNMNLPQYQADKIDVPKFAAIAEKYGIYYTIHLDENLNPCDFNGAVAAAYTDTVVRTIELAKRLNIPVLDMHLSSGVYFTLPDKKVYLFDEYRDVYLHKLQTFRDECERAIGGFDIKICVENTIIFQTKFGEASISLLLESAMFALTFDIGHVAANDFLQQPLIFQHIDKLKHMHIHDVKDKRDHLPLGTGELDLPRYLKLAGEHNCRCVLETKTIEGLRQSVAWLRERGAV